MSNADIEKTLNTFMVLSSEQNNRTEKKLETLIESINNLTSCHIESKKDREFDSARMGRIEKNSDSQEKTLKTLSDTVLILNEHVNSQSSKWKTVGGFVVIVAAAVISASITSTYF